MFDSYSREFVNLSLFSWVPQNPHFFREIILMPMQFNSNSSIFWEIQVHKWKTRPRFPDPHFFPWNYLFASQFNAFSSSSFFWAPQKSIFFFINSSVCHFRRPLGFLKNPHFFVKPSVCQPIWHIFVDLLGSSKFHIFQEINHLFVSQFDAFSLAPQKFHTKLFCKQFRRVISCCVIIKVKVGFGANVTITNIFSSSRRSFTASLNI